MCFPSAIKRYQQILDIVPCTGFIFRAPEAVFERIGLMIFVGA